MKKILEIYTKIFCFLTILNTIFDSKQNFNFTGLSNTNPDQCSSIMHAYIYTHTQITMTNLLSSFTPRETRVLALQNVFGVWNFDDDTPTA